MERTETPTPDGSADEPAAEEDMDAPAPDAGPDEGAEVAADAGAGTPAPEAAPEPSSPEAPPAEEAAWLDALTADVGTDADAPAFHEGEGDVAPAPSPLAALPAEEIEGTNAPTGDESTSGAARDGSAGALAPDESAGALAPDESAGGVAREGHARAPTLAADDSSPLDASSAPEPDLTDGREAGADAPAPHEDVGAAPVVSPLVLLLDADIEATDASPADGSADASPAGGSADASPAGGSADAPPAGGSADAPPAASPNAAPVAVAAGVPDAAVPDAGPFPSAAAAHPEAGPPRARAAGRARRSPQGVARYALWALEVLVVFALVFGGTFAALDARSRITQARVLARAGLQHLEAAEALIPRSGKLDAALDRRTLAQLQAELTAAELNFGRLRAALGAPQGSFAIAAHLPVTGNALRTADQLATAADEACLGGLALLQGWQTLVPIIGGGIFASAAGAGTPTAHPHLTPEVVAQLQADLAGALAHLDSAVASARTADFSALPSSLVRPDQLARVRALLTTWPALRVELVQVITLLNAAPAALGLTGQARYLIEVMDRSELRPGGGFIGNYAVATMASGQIQPVTLTDTYLLDLPYLQQVDQYSPAPAAYPWWPWAHYFGLRDSNLSADFPTSAGLGMQTLQREGGPSVQGVIAITAPAIARILQVTGPIAMPDYRQTVTAQNLEQLIHFYQEEVGNDPLTGLPPSDQISSSRKRFTALLGRALLDKLRGLPVGQLLPIGQALIASLHTKDVQIYSADPQLEAALAQHGVDGAVTRGPGDGVTIVDANTTANKGSQFATVAYDDTITLDAHGTATHHLTITYTFVVTDPTLLYGPDRYQTYLRVYAPPTATLTSLTGLHNLGGFDQIGHSDLPGRQMWGGYVVVQDHIPYVLRLQWSVPNAASEDGHGHRQYTVDFQHQAGSNQTLDLTILPPGRTTAAAHYAGPLDSDHVQSLTY